LYYPTNRDIT